MHSYLAILGRQPEISLAELQALYGHDNVRLFSHQTALVETSAIIDIQQLGGSLKIGRVILTQSRDDLQAIERKLQTALQKDWSQGSGKITLGLSAYDWRVTTKQLQRIGLSLKNTARKAERSLRLIPNQDIALSTATSHHNKLGLSSNKVELLFARGKDGSLVVASGTGAQNISALAARDQERPKRDAFVGMLPPKLALTMINLAHPKPGARVLDPFCGTGVVLQEASLLGFNVYGSDLSDKMIDYTGANLDWIRSKYRIENEVTLHQADATTATWQQPIGAVVTETYLGQPFSAPPRPEKLTQVRGNCNHIIEQFLGRLNEQLESGTPLCLAVPAWRDNEGHITRLPLVTKLARHGFILKHPEPLLYYREDQVVARDILVLEKS